MNQQTSPTRPTSSLYQAWQVLRAHSEPTAAPAATRAAREGRLLSLDPTLLVGGLGPRLPDGMAVLSKGFYPSAPALTEKSMSQP